MNESRYSELLRTVFLKTKEGLLEWERHKTSGHKHPVFILKLGEGSIRLRLGLATNNPWYDVVLADRDGSLVDKRSGAEPPSGFGRLGRFSSRAISDNPTCYLQRRPSHIGNDRRAGEKIMRGGCGAVRLDPRAHFYFDPTVEKTNG